MKKSILFLLLLLVGIGSSSTFAQNGTTRNDAGSNQILANDPIVAMLDSLVKLNYISRYNSRNEKPKVYEGPALSAEEYRERLKRLGSPISLDYNEQVKAYIDLYALRKRELTSTIMGLTNLYFPMFEQMLDQQGLPLEFKYLAVIESALNPLAVSHCGATGLWQFMYETGRQYNLNITSFVDERKDPHASTLAACKYFKNMYSIYHDWLLVIAAYNCGPGNVNRAIARSGGKRNFWEICKYLPQETRGYVPAFIAVNYVLNYSKEHGLIANPAPIVFYEVDTVMVNHTLSFDLISSSIDVPVQVLQYLNPSYKKGIIPVAYHSQRLRLPAAKASTFAANSAAIYKRVIEQENIATIVQPALASNTESQSDVFYDYVTKEVKKVHQVKKRENISDIARNYKCSLAELKQWNKLKNLKVRPGQKLIVYATVTQKIQRKTDAVKNDVNMASKATVKDSLAKENNSVAVKSDKELNDSREEQVAEDQPIKAVAKVKYVYHTVQRGDTLWNIAQRYNGTSIQMIREINNGHDLRRLVPGTKIKVAVLI